MAGKGTAVAVAATVTAVLGGLIAMAVPAVSVVTASSDALSTAAGSIAQDFSTPPPQTTAVSSPTPQNGGLPAGYVEIGHGMAIPAGGAGDCTATAWFWTGSDGDATSMHAELLGTLTDMGPMTHAEGTVNRDSSGTIVSYTIAPGDAIFAIGDRLCAEGLTIAGYNNVRTSEIQPGQTLDLHPDPTATWTSMYG